MTRSFFICIILLSLQAVFHLTTAIEDPGDQKNNTKLQAKISLETRSMDIDDKALQTFHDDAHSTASNKSLGGAVRGAKRKQASPVGERANRKSTNLWAMFMPSNPEKNEDEMEYEDKTEESMSRSNNRSSSDPRSETPNVSPVENTLRDLNRFDLNPSQTDSEKDDKKNSRPPRQEGRPTSLPTELTPLNYDSSDRLGAADRWTSSSSAVTTTQAPENGPIQLITGDLSKDFANIHHKDINAEETRGENDHEKFGRVSEGGGRIGSSQPDNQTDKSLSPQGRPDRNESKSNQQIVIMMSRSNDSLISESQNLSNTIDDKDRRGTSLGAQSGQDRDSFKSKAKSFSHYRWTDVTKAYQESVADPEEKSIEPTSIIDDEPTQHSLRPTKQQHKSTSTLRYQHNQHPIQQHLARRNHKLAIRNPSAQASTMRDIRDAAVNSSMPESVNLDLVNSMRNDVGSLILSQQTMVGGNFNNGFGQSQNEILRQVTNAINLEQQLDQRAPSLNESGDPKMVAGTPDALRNKSLLGDKFDFNSNNSDKKFRGQPTLNITALLSHKEDSGNGANKISINEMSNNNAEVVPDKLLVQKNQQMPTGLASGQPSWLRRPELNLIKPGSGMLASGANLSSLLSLIEPEERSEALGRLMEFINKNSSLPKNNVLKQVFKGHNHRSNVTEGDQILLNDKPQMQYKTMTSAHLDKPASRVLTDSSKGNVSNVGWTPLNHLAVKILPTQSPLSPGQIAKGKTRPPILNLLNSQKTEPTFGVSLSDHRMKQLETIFENLRLSEELSSHSSIHSTPGHHGGVPAHLLQQKNLFDNEPTSRARSNTVLSHSKNQVFPGGLNLDAPVSHGTLSDAMEDNGNIGLFHSYGATQAHPGRQDQPLPPFNQKLAPNELLTSRDEDVLRKISMTHAQENLPVILDTKRVHASQTKPDTILVNPNTLLGSQYIVSRPQDRRLSLSDAAFKPDNLMSQHSQTRVLAEAHSGSEIRNNRSQSSTAHGGDSVLLKQAQQQMQQQVLAPTRTIVVLNQDPYLGLPHVPLRQIFAPHGPIAVSGSSGHNSGPSSPLRLREVSVYRPSGYESHHSFAYQASPTVAALFPNLAQGSRVSFLRNMGPFKTRFAEPQLIPYGQRPITRETIGNQQLEALASINYLHPYNALSLRAPQQDYGDVKRKSMMVGDTWKHRLRTIDTHLPKFESSHLDHDSLLLDGRNFADQRLDSHLEGFMDQVNIAENDELPMFSQHSHLVPKVEKPPITVTLKASDTGFKPLSRSITVRRSRENFVPAINRTCEKSIDDPPPV